MTHDAVLPRKSDVPASFVTQAVHPALGTPFWHIHPCETSTAMAVPMKQLAVEQAGWRNYVATWLTMYVVPLGLGMSTTAFFSESSAGFT